VTYAYSVTLVKLTGDAERRPTRMASNRASTGPLLWNVLGRSGRITMAQANPYCCTCEGLGYLFHRRRGYVTCGSCSGSGRFRGFGVWPGLAALAATVLVTMVYLT
jgi:hypothetical protein